MNYGNSKGIIILNILGNSGGNLLSSSFSLNTFTEYTFIRADQGQIVLTESSFENQASSGQGSSIFKIGADAECNFMMTTFSDVELTDGAALFSIEGTLLLSDNTLSLLAAYDDSKIFKV